MLAENGHTDLLSIVWRFMLYILNNVLLFSGYLVFTMFIVYYFEKICCCWLYRFTAG